MFSHHVDKTWHLGVKEKKEHAGVMLALTAHWEKYVDAHTKKREKYMVWSVTAKGKAACSSLSAGIMLLSVAFRWFWIKRSDVCNIAAVAQAKVW